MKGRVQVFAFEFAAKFKKILRQEIASVDAFNFERSCPTGARLGPRPSLPQLSAEV